VATAVAALPAAPLSPVVFLEAVTFRMGALDGRENGPEHEVRLAAYGIDRFEVSVRDYTRCVQAHRCTLPRHDARCASLCNWGRPDREGHPVNAVSYEQAEAYCQWVGKRLPTEAEWEYAAAGPEGLFFPWGMKTPSDEPCWQRKEEGTCPLDASPRDVSPLGVRNLGGNVSEWVSGIYCNSYDPKVSWYRCFPTSHIVRGGTYRYHIDSLMRAQRRMEVEKDSGISADTGFRCAQDEARAAR
jgi:formylglycine-generating enzyme required for sulfatase activity